MPQLVHIFNNPGEAILKRQVLVTENGRQCCAGSFRLEAVNLVFRQTAILRIIRSHSNLV